MAYLYFIASLIVLVIGLVVAPFFVFPDRMEDYGTYLTGLAAIGAALKFVAPYLLLIFYRDRYSNELIWKAFLNVSEPELDGRILETGWIAGLINYFRRCEESLGMRSSWYDKLPYLSDELYAEFGGKHLSGRKENKLFEEIKGLIFKAANIVAMNSTPGNPMVNEKKYKELHGIFKDLVKKMDEMNDLIVDVPMPVKKIIEDNGFFKSFFKK